MLDGPGQPLGQLFGVVVLVDETVHALGDEPGGAGVLRHDGGLAEDEALGDESRHGVVAGGADEAGTLGHQTLDLVAGEPLDVKDVVGAVSGQAPHGVHHLSLCGLAHEEEGCLLHGLRRQQPDGLAEDVLTFPVLEGTHGGEQRPPARIAQIVVGELLGGVVRQAVDEGPDVELRPHRVHGVGGVAADGVEPDIFAQLSGDLVGDVGVACKGIVEPPEHRHPRTAQGADGPGLHDGVGQNEVGAEGQPPEQGRLDTALAGDDGSSRLEEERHGAAVLRAEDDHFVAHAAQHRHGAHQHDGRTGHVQQVAHDKDALPLYRPDVFGADVPLIVGQRQREADVAAAELRRQRQQFDGIFRVAGFRLTAAQQLPGDECAARAGCKALTVVEGGDA